MCSPLNGDKNICSVMCIIRYTFTLYNVHVLGASSSKETILPAMLPVFVKLSDEGPFVTEEKESRARVGEGGYFFTCWQTRDRCAYA